jgi:hypothetical protein
MNDGATEYEYPDDALYFGVERFLARAIEATRRCGRLSAPELIAAIDAGGHDRTFPDHWTHDARARLLGRMMYYGRLRRWPSLIVAMTADGELCDEWVDLRRWYRELHGAEDPTGNIGGLLEYVELDQLLARVGPARQPRLLARLSQELLELRDMRVGLLREAGAKHEDVEKLEAAERLHAELRDWLET